MEPSEDVIKTVVYDLINSKSIFIFLFIYCDIKERACIKYHQKEVWGHQKKKQKEVCI